MEDFTLEGKYVTLVPLNHEHVSGLVQASSEEPSLYRWSLVPQGESEAKAYVEAALMWKSEGTAMPFAIVRSTDGAIIGSTRFFDLESWSWPAGHSRNGRDLPDVGEIGYTWLARSAIRSAVNTEAKYLMLRHAFEEWGMLRICLHTDVRNQRSRAAIERIGGVFEGVLRSHRLAADATPRDSARYSILVGEWPAVKARLEGFLSTSREASA